MVGLIIRPSELPNRASPVASEKIPTDNGSDVGGVTIENLVLAGRPTASQAEAEAGVQASKAMTPLTTKQAINALGDVRFASAAQGAKADTAVQAVTAEELFADVAMSYSSVTEGDDIYTTDGRFSVAASGATDHHAVTAGGVKLYDDRPLDEAPQLRQRKHYEPFAGFDDGTTDTQIFDGSRLPPQGFCRLTISGVEYDFVALVDDSGGSSPERYRIVQYIAGTAAHVAYSGILDLAHVQDLSGSVDGTSVTLYCQMSDGVDDGKGISVIEWDGASTTTGDVTDYQLFGSASSGHRFERYTDATVGVRGDVVVLLANDSKDEVDDTGHYLFVYSLAEILAAGDPLDVEPKVGPLAISVGVEEGQNTLQGCDVQEDHFRLLRGFVNPRQRKCVQFWDFRGNLLRTIEYAGSLNDWTAAQLGNHSTYETLITQEPEGLSSDSRGRLLVLCAEEWRETGDVVSYEGKNFTPRRSNVTSSPMESDDWVETSETPSGAWVAGTYTYGGDYTRRAKVIHMIDKPLVSGADKPLSNAAQFSEALASVKSGDNAVDVAVPLGSDFLAAGFLAAVGKLRRLFGHYSSRSLRLFDARDGSDNSKYASIASEFSTGREVAEYRVNGSTTTGAAFNAYGKDDSLFPGWFRFWAAKAAGTAVEFFSYDPDNDRYFPARRIEQSLFTDAVQSAHTGSTSETTLKTYVIPGGMLGAKGYFILDLITSQTNNANSKTLRVKVGATTIVTTTAGVTSTASLRRLTKFQNRNSVSSQIFFAPSATSDPGTTTVAIGTSTIDSSADMTLTITGQLTNGADSIAVEAVVLKVCYAD